MIVTITETSIHVQGAKPCEIEGLPRDIGEMLEFLEAFTWILNRASEELGMVAARSDALKAIDKVKGDR